MHDLLQVEKWPLLAALIGAAGVWFTVEAPEFIESFFWLVCLLGGVASTAAFFFWEARYYYDADQSASGTSVFESVAISGILVAATYIALMMASIYTEEWYHSRRTHEQK